MPFKVSNAEHREAVVDVTRQTAAEKERKQLYTEACSCLSELIPARIPRSDLGKMADFWSLPGISTKGRNLEPGPALAKVHGKDFSKSMNKT